MNQDLPRTTHRTLQFQHGAAIGMSHRWHQGQYCSILTEAGIVGCGIYDLKTPAEFDQAIAIAKGTPANPLTEPEDLFDAKIVGVTPKAESLGIRVGMKGREAVELMLQARRQESGVRGQGSGVRGQESGIRGQQSAASGQAIDSRPLTPDSRPLTPDSCSVKSIDHVTLVVKDLEASRRFYVDVLGMREVPRPAFSFAGSWFQAGATQIHLILEFAGSGPAGNLLAPERRGSRTQHVAFLVDDAAAAVRTLKAMSVPILSDVKPRPDGYLQVFVSDPDGHVIELCSPRGSFSPGS
jgi:catechol 2,3-dioxygenase-like lactoylglutathione lyase family enzyme/uncharacterized protein YunC (DUF1805 family)